MKTETPRLPRDPPTSPKSGKWKRWVCCYKGPNVAFLFFTQQLHTSVLPLPLLPPAITVLSTPKHSTPSSKLALLWRWRRAIRRKVSRVLVRGTLTDAHNEITRTQVEAFNSTLWSYMCAVVDDRSLEDGNSVERISQGSSASYCRIRKRARANREASSARTPPAA